MLLYPIQLNRCHLEYLRLIQSLFHHQSSSNFLLYLSEIPFKPLRNCCEKVMQKLTWNPYYICIESTQFYSSWRKERQFRITGSKCYGLYTYKNNSNPNWESKSLNYFYPKDVSNKFMKHGLKYEPEARKKYETETSVNVLILQ